MNRGGVWGNPRLFVADDSARERFRVRVGGELFGPVLASLALATAQARAAAVDGRSAEIASLDGTVAVIEHTNGGFIVTSCGPASWPARCTRLLAEHG